MPLLALFFREPNPSFSIIENRFPNKAMTSNNKLNQEMVATKARYQALQMADGGVPESLAEDREQQARLLQHWCEGTPRIGEKTDVVIPTRYGSISARLYVPEDPKPGPAAIFLHGGGWARGSTANGEWTCCAVTHEASIRVLSINYSLAPEHPFPTALNEVEDTIDWCRDSGPAMGIDAQRIVLFGASAGANLALAATLVCRDEDKPLPLALGLLYGVFDNDFETRSYHEFGAGQFGLSLARMKQYFEWYVPTGTDADLPRITPMKADLRHMPPCWVGFGEFDVLRDDSIGIEKRLRAAGVETRLRRFDDLPHGFATYARTVARSREALSDLSTFLRTRVH